MKSIKKPYLLAAIAGGINALAFWMPSLAWIMWIGLVPFFYALQQQVNKTWKLGAVYGLSMGAVFQIWIFEGASNFVGSVGIMTIIGYLVLIFLYSLLPISFAYLVGKWKQLRPLSKKWLDIISFAVFWTGIEWLHFLAFDQLPWINDYLGYTQAVFLYPIQITAITGIWGVSFLIVVTNILVTLAILTKKKKFLVATVLLLISLNFGGWLSVQQIEGKKVRDNFKVAILQENFDIKTEWNKETGNNLANVFFSLNDQAAQQNADIILWSEGALPWTFQTDDDLVQEALRRTWSTRAEHVIGMTFPTEQNDGGYYNSALHFQADGRLTGRYDKRYLLTFFEQPLFSHLSLPIISMFNEIGLNKDLKSGKKPVLLNTKQGLAGVGICNEWLHPTAIRTVVKEGATYLLNSGNNGFSNKLFLPTIHFYGCRLRAIENRRTVAVNCNYGYSGMVAASGKTIPYLRADKPQCLTVDLHQNKKLTFYTKYGDWLPKFCLLLGIILFVGGRFKSLFF